MKPEIKQRIEQINNGQVPEGYKKTELGIFPYDWENKNFKQACDIFSGGTPDTSVSEYWNGDIPWCTPTDISKAPKYIFDTEKKITTLGLQESSATLMPKNSIIMCSRATIGPRSINTIPMATNQGFKNLICKEGYSTEFIYHYIEIMLDKMISKSSGSTFLELSKSTLERMICPFPTFKEQEKIAEILMKWDKVIELQEKTIEKLHTKRDAVVKRVIKKKEGWHQEILSNILVERTEFATKEDGYPHASLTMDGVTQKTDRYNRDFLVKSDDKKYKVTHYNDICYNPANLKFGVICVNKYDNDAIFSPIYVTYEVNPQYNTDFIGSILCSADFIRYIRKYEEGTVYERQAVKSSDFLRGVIWVPDTKEEQDQIASIISEINTYIQKQVDYCNSLKQQRKALQQYLLNGIVRVEV